MRLATVFGLKIDLDEFAGLGVADEKIVGLVSGMVADCKRRIPEIDLSLIAARAIDAATEAVKTFDPLKGRFTTHAGWKIRGAITAALNTKDGFVEASLRIPRGKTTNVSFLRLDASEYATHDQIGTDRGSLAETLDTRDLLAELSEPIETMLGMLRVIPLRQNKRQQHVEIFETCYGLNGRDEKSLGQVARTWKLVRNRPSQIVAHVWKRLGIAKSPILTPLQLRNLLHRIEHLQEIIGECRPIRPRRLESDEARLIAQRFAEYKVGWQTDSAEKRYQLSLNLDLSKPLAVTKAEAPKGCPVQLELDLGPDIPITVRDDKDLIVLASCRVFGIPMHRFPGPYADNRTARTRHVAMHLLKEDVAAKEREVQTLTNRDRLTVIHGQRQTKRALESGNRSAEIAVKSIRFLVSETKRSLLERAA